MAVIFTHNKVLLTSILQKQTPLDVHNTFRHAKKFFGGIFTEVYVRFSSCSRSHHICDRPCIIRHILLQQSFAQTFFFEQQLPRDTKTTCLRDPLVFNWHAYAVNFYVCYRKCLFFGLGNVYFWIRSSYFLILIDIDGPRFPSWEEMKSSSSKSIFRSVSRRGGGYFGTQDVIRLKYPKVTAYSEEIVHA